MEQYKQRQKKKLNEQLTNVERRREEEEEREDARVPSSNHGKLGNEGESHKICQPRG